MQTKHLGWALAVTALVGAGCGAELSDSGASTGADDVGQNDELSSVDDALSTKAPTFVTLRMDYRKCASPMCGGYWVRDLNSNAQEQYVYALSASPSTIDAATLEQVRSQPANVLLKGKLSRKSAQGLRRFIVQEAYRGMPGITPAADATYYSVSERGIQCIRAPCDVYAATALNEKKAPVTVFAEVDVGMSLMPLVDADWLTQLVVQGQAIVAGNFVEKAFDFIDGPGWPIKTLDATQVYVRLPENAGPCPMVKIAGCQPGETMTYARSADRCVLPTGCTPIQACPRLLPQCAEGYTLASWPGEGGCSQYACDPSFVGEQWGGTTQSSN